MNLHNTYFVFLKKGAWIVSQFLKKGGSISILMLLATVSFGQTTIDRTVACSCINNSAPLGQAQFYEELTISSSINETWYISSVSGLYQSNSPVPPEQQIPFSIGVSGDTMVADGLGNYTLEGIHIEDLGYSIELTNGVDTARLDNILCAYPNATIIGDIGICEGESIEYFVENPDPNYDYQWSISGQGNIVGAVDGSSIEVDWDDDGTGEEFVFVQVTGPNGCGQLVNITVEFEDNIILACNNQVQLAVSADCVLEVVPDDILESMKYDDLSYEITLIDPETGNEIPLGSPASDYLFDTLEISIEHLCSGNSCWGNIVFEDKYVPPLICENDTISCSANDSPEALGFPLPNTAVVTPNGPNTYIVGNFDACGDATLEYEDSELEMACNEDFASEITRTWTLTDFSGSTTSCQEFIRKTRTTVNDVVFPGDWDGVTNPVLLCDGNYPVLPNGNPDPSYTGMPSGGICDHINVSYVDLISEICGATYKVVRKWTVVDECTSQEITNNQLLKIEDNEAPDFNCPSSQTFDIVDDHSCDANVSVAVPTNYYDCSAVSFSAEIVQLDENGNVAGLITDMDLIGGQFIASDRALGEHRITYTALDECGFASSCSFSIYVVDNTPPIAVCDLATTIALDNAGNAIVPVSTFDNGSFDNCSVDRIEVSRGNNPCGASSGFSDHITLCCADANQDVMVTLRVVDMAGNMNTCMVMVSVQDKKAPILECPDNLTIPCTSDYSDLSIFGQATASDNCSVTITETSDIQVNSCGTGTIYRDFTAVDPAGNETVCTQIINLNNNNPFVYSDIIWPADYNTNNCVSPALDPDDLPSIYAYPILSVKPCSDPVFDYDDKVYTNASGACQTIFRTWTVIDQCTDNQFEFTQKLNINDNEKPVFEECSNKTLDGEETANCSYHIEYTKTVSDDCTLEEDLYISYTIDLDNNGGSDITGSSAQLNEALPVGVHAITWRAEDGCNNIETCTELITIIDAKKPTPYCLGGISTVVMPSTGTIAVWASDFDLNSEDNCTEQEDLVFSFSPTQSDQSRTFTCEDLEGLDEKFFELEIYVHDASGNYDFCTSMIRITATTACDTSNTIMIGGAVYTEDLVKMGEVEMYMESLEDLENLNTMTDAEGNYAFANISSMINYTLTPNYEGDYLNGVSTLDIILIQKHILGLEVFDSPYKVIAADVDASESISGADIVQLRKLILGHFDALPNNSSWKFVAEDQEFTDLFNPWPLEENIELLSDDSYMSEDFVSIKVGDVNLSRTMNFSGEEAETRNNKSLTILWEEQMQDGQHQIVFSLDEEQQISGWQLFLEMDHLEGLKDIQSEIFNPSDGMMHMRAEGVAMAFSSAYAQRVSEELFRLNFGPMSPQKIFLHEGQIFNEIYVEKENGEIEVRRVELKRKKENSVSTEMIVYQNQPNPFTDFTEINFMLGQGDYVRLEIRNMDGALLLEKNGFFKKGINQYKVYKNELPLARSEGLLIYTLINSNSQVSNKMVAIK